jgi:protein gp37
MGSKTGISWTDSTWNPVTGCSKISAGCKNCYAKQLHDKRYKAYHAGKAMPEQYSTPFEVIRLHNNRLQIPIHWKKPRKIFVCSTGDLFHEGVSFYFIEEVWDIMFDCPEHTFQILTKRPDRMLEFANWMVNRRNRNIDYHNVWLGTSIENQEQADERIPYLLSTPAQVRFISAEPLLGELNLSKPCGFDKPIQTQAMEGISWVIVGGESGKAARSMNMVWAWSIRYQCKEFGVPFFMKQLSQADYPNTFRDFNSFPKDLQIREFPNV